MSEFDDDDYEDQIEKANEKFLAIYGAAYRNAKTVAEVAEAVAEEFTGMMGDTSEEGYDEQLDVDIRITIAERGMKAEDAATFTRLVYEAVERINPPGTTGCLAWDDEKGLVCERVPVTASMPKRKGH